MKRLRIGNPFKTEAIVNNIDIEDIDQIKSISSIVINKGEGFNLKYKMERKDLVYGLGENVGGLNKRGLVYESFCSDEFDHTPDKKSLYAAHNFIVVDGKDRFGLFVDYPGKLTFDIGYTDKDTIEIISEKADLDLYIIEGDSLKDIVKQFRVAIGESYIPPKWALGYQQSRWSYPDEAAVKDIAKKFKESKIPCDTIYLDIDYMEQYKNFTVDKVKFANFSNFVKEMKDLGIRLIPIIDAGCKIEDGYPVYEEGVENNYYCVDKDGNPFVGAVWPGKVHFPDFMKPEVRKWFGDKYSYLIDQGIEGFWNDMNEPAIFYSEDGMKKAFDTIDSMKGKNLGLDEFFALRDSVMQLANNDADYKSFYHNVDGELVNHYDIHNIYGYNMTRAAGESINEMYKNKRFLLFSRASYVGMHRYGGIWTGDNKSWWEHLELNIKMMPSLNMVGFIYSGADVGGFGCSSSAELVTRWTQFSIFTPLLRNHATMGTRFQEPFSFDKETTDTLREVIKTRYALIPYIYSEYMKSVKNYDSYFKPLCFEYHGEMEKRVEDQLLVGDSIMLAPIYKANSIGRNVYLPEEMLLWNIKNYKEVECSLYKAGLHHIDVELEEIPIFIRKNQILVLGNHADNVDSIDNRELSLVALVEDRAEYTLYDDDGTTFNFRDGIFSELKITIEKDGDSYKLDTNVKGDIDTKVIKYYIYDINGNLKEGVYTL